MVRDVPARVLIADDDTDFCDVVSFALADEGFDTQAVTTPEDALAALRGDSWSLVLLDSLGTTPGPSFDAMLAQLSAAAGDTPFVLASGWTVHAEAEGVAAVIRKPFDLDPFLALLAQLIGTDGRT
jgi:DNA-binding NtrC family response regulator